MYHSLGTSTGSKYLILNENILVEAGELNPRPRKPDMKSLRPPGVSSLPFVNRFPSQGGH